MAAKDAKKKGGKDDPKKKGGKEAKKDDRVPTMSVRSHPRARGSVRRAKGWGGLIGFGVAVYLSLSANVPLTQVGLRALGVGAAGYLVAWACAVAVWRVLLVAELKVVYDQLQADKAERAEKAKAAKPGGPAAAAAAGRPEAG